MNIKWQEMATRSFILAMTAFFIGLLANNSYSNSAIKTANRAADSSAMQLSSSRLVVTDLKLMRSVLLSRSDAEPAIDLEGNPIDGTRFDLQGTTTSVTCPKQTKCFVEVQVNASWLLGNLSSAASAVQVDGSTIGPDGIVSSPMDDFSTVTSWTYIKRISVGRHTIKPSVFLFGPGTLFGHIVTIRLYRK